MMEVKVFIEDRESSPFFGTYHYCIYAGSDLMAHDAGYKDEKNAFEAAYKRQRQLYEWDKI